MFQNISILCTEKFCGNFRDNKLIPAKKLICSILSSKGSYKVVVCVNKHVVLATPSVSGYKTFHFGQRQTVLSLTKFIDKYSNIYNTKLVSSNQ